MTPYKLDYVARPQSYDFHTREQRWAVNVCHRRAGKALGIATPIPIAVGSFKLMGSAIPLSCSVTKY